jgi:hypothetical protein
VVFTTPVRLKSLDLSVQKTLNMSLKGIENFFYIRFVFKEINPAKTRIVINKANIVLVPPRGDTGRPPNIIMNQYKRYRRDT